LEKQLGHSSASIGFWKSNWGIPVPRFFDSSRIVLTVSASGCRLQHPRHRRHRNHVRARRFQCARASARGSSGCDHIVNEYDVLIVGAARIRGEDARYLFSAFGFAGTHLMARIVPTAERAGAMFESEAARNAPTEQCGLVVAAFH
jgi:hypothetical protein